MTSKERIEQLEAENRNLRAQISKLELVKMPKSARPDPLPVDKVKADFNLSTPCYASDIAKLKRFVCFLIFAEATYTSAGTNTMRIRADYMSDAQYKLYCEILDKVYLILLEGRNESISQHLNVWDLNSPNVPQGIVRHVESKFFKNPYIHRGETDPRKGD